MWQLNLSFWMLWRHFVMRKSKEANWPSGGVHFDLRTWSVSKISLSEALELSSLSWKKAFNWMRRRNFSTSCLTENSSVLFAIETKFRPLLRTDFSESVSGRFSGIVTTVFWPSNVAWLQIWEKKPDFYGRYIDDCIGAISSSREELNRLITSVNSFHPALKYTWEILETLLAFLDTKVSINGNGLCTSVHCKPTDSHSYSLHSSSHPSHVKNSIPYSQFLRHLCSDDSDFSNISQEMCQFFEKRGYPASVIQMAHHRAQQLNNNFLVKSTFKTIEKPGTF